jgi:RimJ/RimL family protein N-acetyltransferase
LACPPEREGIAWVRLFVFLTYMGIARLSVNTQSDNQASLSLYQRMGFVRTGEQYPVYTFDIPAYP